ncbi:MAG: hypothetical protein ABN478_02785 [Mixta sp.]
MTLMESFRAQLEKMGKIKRVWLTSFNINISFIEKYLLPAVLGQDIPVNRLHFEGLQKALVEQKIDFRIWCDKQIFQHGQPKQTSVVITALAVRELFPLSSGNKKAASWEAEMAPHFGKRSLFHPKVIYLEDEQGRIVIGAGSANLTLNGWGRNQEVFDFRCVSNNEQYHQIKQFFIRIGAATAQDFRKKIRWGDDEEWAFIHSLGGKTLLDALRVPASPKAITELSVWSPYLAGDLPTFITQLAQQTENQRLKIRLVPDMLGGAIRTLWCKEIAALQQSGQLAFCRNPCSASRDERVEMIHAKIWYARSAAGRRMAIGSWNFTRSGCASLEGERNIEAGIVHRVKEVIEIAGERWQVKRSDFADREMLDNEQLVLQSLPPFDLEVIFDWRLGEYQISGVWQEGDTSEAYQLQLPAIAEAIPLSWEPIPLSRKPIARALLPLTLSPTETDELLTQRFYTLLKDGKPCGQGIILEKEQVYRRVEAFSSLEEILESYASGLTPTESDRTILRGSHQSEEAEPHADRAVAVSSVMPSYFRLFYAMAQRRNVLEQAPTPEQLYFHLFSEPGCLLELVEKTNQCLAQLPESIFNWFLQHEVRKLASLAQERYSDYPQASREAFPVSAARWRKLTVNACPVNNKKNAQRQRYIALIMSECGYE